RPGRCWGSAARPPNAGFRARAMITQGADRVSAPARLAPESGPGTRNGLFVITDTAAQIADLGYEAHFLKRRREGARLWKLIARHLSDFTFRLLRCGVDCRTICLAACVLEGSNVRASWNSLRTGESLPVRDPETEWIKIAVQEPALSLDEHRYRHGLVRLYSGDSLVEHGPSLLGP